MEENIRSRHTGKGVRKSSEGGALPDVINAIAESIKALLDWFSGPSWTLATLNLLFCRRIQMGPKLKDGERVKITVGSNGKSLITHRGVQYAVQSVVDIDIDGNSAGSIVGEGSQTVSGPGQVYVHLKDSHVEPPPPSDTDIDITQLPGVTMKVL